MLLFSQETSYPFLTGHADKAFFACSLPFDERLFAPAGEDISDEMVIVGSNLRSRSDFVTALEAYGIPVTAHLNQRQAGKAPDTAEYGAILRQAGMTFTEQAFSWHQRHYPSGWFWSALLKRLGLPVAA